MRTGITFLGIMLFCSVVLAQQGRYISGRITDAEDGEPVPAVTVFFTNTTVGTTTDQEGRYRLRIPGEGSYTLTVSHVGYQAVVKDIEPGTMSIVFDVSLQIQELEDVSVSANVRFRRSDINLFWRTLLGKNPSRRSIQATNPETVYYYYNPETKILKVTCREPLQIVNYETGYHIQCIVSNFSHDYTTGITDWNVQNVFTELEPANMRQKTMWAVKREEVYNVSLVKFFKSLYNNSLKEDGFALADIIPTTDPANPSLLYMISQDSLLSTVSADKSKALNLSNHELLLVSFGRPVTGGDLDRLQRLQYQRMQTKNKSLFEQLSEQQAHTREISERTPANSNVITEKELEPSRTRFIPQSNQLENIGLYRNLLQGESIRIFPDGTYSNKLQITPVSSSETLFGLSMKLPIEFLPDNSFLSRTGTDTASKDYQSNIFADIDRRLKDQWIIFPQEKIHLHTDRDIYVSGEKIWFKAYVTDANSHLNTTKSNYVYAELISPVDTLVSRVMILQEEGMFHGYMPVPANVPEGDYTLRAYTRYMENLGDDYFFKKNIRIGSPTPTLPEREGVRNVTGRSTERANNAPLSGELEGAFFDVTFYPEGGNLPEGVVHKVAFKALNRNGYPEAITGYLIDESGIESTPIQTIHAGMGVFSYRPEAGKTYRLKCTGEKGVEKVFELPQSDPRARSLAVSILSEGIIVGIQKSGQSPDIPCYLLVHCRGNVLFFSEMDGQKTVSFDKEELPAGVIQCVLFDEQMNPLSERLVFSQNEATVPVDFHTDKNEYQIRDKIVVTLSLPDSLFGAVLSPFGGGVGGGLEDFNKAPALYEAADSLIPRRSETLRRAETLRQTLSHFSIAVTDDKDVAVDESTTILSSLLLSSELKGYIENPAYYLHDPVAMDLLMMTHGWRRYNIPEVVQGRPEMPKIPFQQYQTISGSVNTTTIFNRSVPDSEIIIAMEKGGYGVISTDENGSFIASELNFPDSTTFFLQALSKKGYDNVKLTVNHESFPELVYAPKTLFSRQKTKEMETKDESDENTFLAKTAQRAKYEEDLWTIQLQEVEVTAPVIKKREPRDDFYLNGSADYTMRREQIDELKLPFIHNYLEMIPGLQAELNNENYYTYYLLPKNLFPPAKIYIDGVEANSEIIHTLTQNEIESIDIVRYASILGVRGTGGAISITTIREGAPEPEKLNHIVYTPLGYQQPVAFYSPKYETWEAKQSSIPDYRTTIFWKPDVVISEAGEANFEFYSSDFPTNYSVVIEGLTADGKIVRQVEKITVRY